MRDDSNKSARTSFLRLAFSIEGGLLVVALIAAWFVGVAPWAKVRVSFSSVALGVLATIPLLIFLAFTYYTRIHSLVQFRELTRELLEKPLAACNWLDLCAVALAAGIAEEFLFRGVLEPSLRSTGPLLSLLICNLIFGLCHALTMTYFVFALVVGVYLSLTMRWSAEPDLVVPICCHALYDLAAFAVIRRSSQKSDPQTPPNDGGSLDPEIHANHPIFPIGQ